MRSGRMKKGAGLVVALLAHPAAAKCCTDPVSRDVVVVGGGAAGAHAAVWLRDNGHSVTVVEKASQLGGHTTFFRDSASGKPINVGVQAWMEYKDAFSFPERMNVSTSGSMSFTMNTAEFIDFTTGLPVEGYAAPTPDELYPALQRYLDAISPYEDMVLPGYFNFPDPTSIPEDLLMPFRDFVKKYNLGAAVPQLWDSTVMGLGDPMDVPTLWVIQASGIPMVKALLGVGAAAVPASGRLYDLYEAVEEFLGDDVLYSSTVVSAERKEKGVTVQVESATGEVTCIEAKRLLIAFEPTTENMAPFRPDGTEKKVLSKIGYSTVYAGILQHPSLQISHAYSDRLPSTVPSNFTEFPLASQVGSINYIGDTDGLFQFTAVGTDEDTPETMKALIGQSIDAMIEAGTIPASEGAVAFAAFADHGKVHARVTADDLRSGFIQDLLSLQGHKSTWYTGAAFSSGFSTVLWEYNDVLLPDLVAGL
ncbi:uncharacterized protein DNG_07967 [Cephalotrichum gorgonifer]|uniref:FAD dependent oxidoreductase n=1 Tax=Cephalotrichum gorgonifer TaxID=2041049 RepID=A0AAE8SXX6_9PEZI|nr:uncharacterized protein DNG_07967 [Cephalotrichum gorgonifer]